jgi:hypothetical protein
MIGLLQIVAVVALTTAASLAVAFGVGLLHTAILLSF